MPNGVRPSISFCRSATACTRTLRVQGFIAGSAMAFQDLGEFAGKRSEAFAEARRVHDDAGFLQTPDPFGVGRGGDPRIGSEFGQNPLRKLVQLCVNHLVDAVVTGRTYR